MSHIHLPDGILPVWIWVLGFIVISIMVSLSSYLISRRPDARKKVPLAAVAAALIIVAMSIPLAPIPVIPVVYHANLSVLAGAIVGPLLAPIVAVVVQLGLWVVGHGGSTTLGLNASVLTLEMIAGWALIRFASRVLADRTKLRAAGYFLATVLVLAASTTAMLGIVSTAGSTIELHAHEESEADHAEDEEDGHEEDEDHDDEEVSLSRFARWIYTVAPIGWVLEGVLTAAALGFIIRVRPGLIGLRPAYEPEDGDERES